ncbi:MAG: hypothetical protein FJZ79_06600 [Chlorobi bacterium]|nr:hypothetical protein [Chlorobiota bacterium]
MAACFIDAHCHLFNFEDVPFYATLRRKVKPIDTLGMLAASLGIVNVDRFKTFIMFFEQPVQANLGELLVDIRKAVPERELLLTPLVMDFFTVNPQTKPVDLQVSHLREGITRCRDLCSGDRVLPFLGYDLRRLKDGTVADFIRYWENSGGVTSAERRRGPEMLQNGDAIGIKLYPPIGFNPDPSKERDPEVRMRYLEFYRWCIAHQVPLTVHCQYSSYSMHNGDRIRYYTHPVNWQKLLRRPGFGSLRLNLAHAGGWEDLVAWQGTGKNLAAENATGRPGYASGTWVPVVISLLKTYPNAYADLSAFNFASRSACSALRKLLEYDERGRYGNGFPLRKKLLWGSDVPMVIAAGSYKERGKPSYRNLYERFAGTVLGSPIENPEEALADMTENNPLKFLFPPEEEPGSLSS